MADITENSAPQPNVQAEKEVLSILFKYADAPLGESAIYRLRPEYFSNGIYRKIFEAIVNLKRQNIPISSGTLQTYVSKLPQTDKRGNPLIQPTVADIFEIDGMPTVATSVLQIHVDTLKALYLKEKAKYSARRLFNATQDPTADIETAIRELESEWQQTEEENDKYDLLTLPTEESRKAEQQKSKDDIETPYYFQTTGTNKEIEQLTLPSGAITFVCAPTSHGKSTFLQNLALYVAQHGNDGSTLYFTFEESKEAVDIQLTNKFINKSLSANNQRSISTYRRKGRDLFRQGQLQTYLDGEKRYLNKLIYNGKLRLYEKDFDSTELIDAIKFLCKAISVKAVFIDYIQLLSKRGNRLQRNEELKEIAKDFKDLAKSTHIPIVMAAQLNREAKSPLEMQAENIAEAADLERIANKVILLWNADKPARSKDMAKALQEWSDRTDIQLGQYTPESGKIYALMAKNRGGISGIEAVFTFHRNEGTIEQQLPKQKEIDEYKAKEGTAEPQQNDPLGTPDNADDADEPF